MQVNILEAKTQLSRLVEAAMRGEDVVIANRGKPMVRLVKAEAPVVKRVAGAWEGLMTEEQIDHAFSPEVEAEMAREWLDSLARPIEAGLKPKRRGPRIAASEKAAGTRTAKRTTRQSVR